MSEYEMNEETKGNSIYLGIFLGPDRYTAPKITIGAPNVAGIMAHLGDLTDPDPNDPDEIAPISYLLDQLVTIDAAVTLKMPNKQPTPSAASSAVTGDASASSGKTCAHGAMKYKEGVSSQSGKAYKAWFCQAPFGQTKCKAQFIN